MAPVPDIYASLSPVPLPRAIAAWTSQEGLHLAVAAHRLDEAGLAKLIEAGGTLPPTLARAVCKRKTEYLAGRACAAEACRALLGRPTPPPASGPDRLPCWPDGVVGSITHGGGIASAVVAPAAAWLGLGIDVEPWLTADRAERLAHRLADAAELDSLQATGLSRREAVSLAFCAKEACFKAVFPRVRQYFDFRAVRLDAEGYAAGGLAATLLQSLGEDWPSGRQIAIRHGVLADSHLLSLCAIPLEPAGAPATHRLK